MSTPREPHVDVDAAGIVMLAPTDPERRDAEAHAAACVRCRRALDSASRTLALLEALPPPPAPSASALARVSDLIAREMEQEARDPLLRPKALPPPVPRSVALAAAAAVVVSFSLLVGLSRAPSHDASEWAVGVALVACAALAVAFGKRLGALAVPGLAVASVGAIAWVASIASPGATPDGYALDAAVGAHCATLELLAAALPFAVASFAATRARVRPSASWLAFVAAAGGVAGQGAMAVACPSREALLHLVVFHAGAVVLAWLLGAALGMMSIRRAA